MFEARNAGPKYRLINKPRFLFCALTALMLFFSALCIANDIGGVSGQAAASAYAPGESAAAASPMPGNGTINGDWRLVLVNATHPLPANFSVETRTLPNGLQLDARAYGDLMRMLQAGKQQGLSLVVCSAYRTVEKQKELFDEQVATEQATGLTYDQAVATAQTKVALPGTSEHNLGLAVDIVAQEYQKLDEGYLNTPECKWLQANSYKYGFIMRYPANKSAVTKIVFEPWHYRYVGVEAATQITQEGVCLEEYLGMED